MSVWTSTDGFVEWLLRASWQATVLAGMVLLAQRWLGRRLTPAWRCRLGWVVIARLLLPVQVPSASSVFNIARFPLASPAVEVRGPVATVGVPREGAASRRVDSFAEPSTIASEATRIPPAAAVDLPLRALGASEGGRSSGSVSVVASPTGAPVGSAVPSRLPRTWWVGLWLVGVAWVAGRTAVQNLAFVARLRRDAEPVSAELTEALDACRRALGVRFRVWAWETGEVRSPAVYGFRRPMLLLPRGLTAEFTREELRHVLLHEMAHVKRRDAAMTWIVAALQALHWFNPLLGLAFARMRVDRELACDAMVLDSARDDEARSYGETILRLLELLNRGAALPGLVGIMEDKDQIRERIRAIASFRRGGGRPALAVLLWAGLGWVGLTDAATSSKPLPPVTPLNLTNLLERAENQSWQEDAVWKVPPRGSNVFGGIEFRIDGLIQLSGTGPEGDGKKYRDRVIVPLVVTNGTGSDARVVRLGAGVGALHWVGGASYDAPVGTKIAEVVWRYVDGSFKRSAIEYGVHLRDWWRTPYEAPARLPGPHAKVVWRGTHDTAERWGGKTLRLYRLSLANPEPRRVISQLEFVSARARPATLILGLTLDPLKPGERPDETPDLEMVDPDPMGRVQVTVVDTDGLSVGGAAIRVNARLAGQQGSGADYPKAFTTDVQGAVEVLHPGQGVERLQLTVSKEDYASRKVVWDTKTGDVLPTTHTVRLVKSLTIGGTVVDPDGSPVEGAKVSLHRYWMGGENMATKGDQPEFEKQEHVTGPDGRWKARHVPPEILHRIAITASHPDYIQASWVGKYDSESLEQLKAGEAKLTLGRGLEVRGRVLDDAERPIAGATVWAGGRDFPDRQETTSDDEGRFVFRNRKEGSTVFSVLAKGRRPENLTRVVGAAMEEVVFKLGPGQTIRAVVRNAEGEALPGVRVVLEGAGDIGRTYEYSTRTDSEGRFEWDGAPDQPMAFYFGLTGYEQKRDQPLTPGVENVVVLRRYRVLVGEVVDAESGEPVKRFRIGVGRAPEFNGAWFYADYPGVTEYMAEDGRFRIELNEERTNALQVESDDHARAMEKLPEPVDDEVRITVRLKPSPGLRGVVLDAAGRPVPGAHVAAVAGSTDHGPVRAGQPTLIAGRLTNRREESVVSSDAEGRFTVPAPPLSGRVVAASMAGFASVPIEVARQAGGKVVLQPYGRIEGTLMVLGRPAEGEEFVLSLTALGVAADFQTHRTTTDGQGRFVFDNVPPGEVGVIRLVKTTPSSWAYGMETPVSVPSGGTARLTVGDGGAVIRGKVRYQAPADAVDLAFEAELFNPMPTIPEGLPPDRLEAFVRSPEWAEAMKKHRRYPVKVGPDGALQLDSVPPGQYTLTVNATVPGAQLYSRTTLASGSMPVTVPQGVSPTEAMEVGDVVLKASSSP